MEKVTSIRVNISIYKKYKQFCKANGLLIGKRIQDLIEADFEKRLIKRKKIQRNFLRPENAKHFLGIPEVKL